MITALPTRYDGVQFRSRLEANMAKFFNQHYVEWAYEQEGFDLDGTWYLPDFWLPEIKTFVEVKGLLDDISLLKVTSLAREVESHGVMVVLAEHPIGERFKIVTPKGELLSYGDTAATLCAKCKMLSFQYISSDNWQCRWNDCGSVGEEAINGGFHRTFNCYMSGLCLYCQD